ncbi:Uncharacterised protein [Mycobacteroides abscessus subsp. abscessus]|nr:Uncharacterised protein [Mycobacteroides abscessus subsp. abscessus]
MLGQLGFAAMPLVDEVVAQYPAAVGTRPVLAAHDVVDVLTDGVVAAHLECMPLGGPGNRGFSCSPEPSSDQHAVGPQRKRRRQSAAIGHPTGCQHQDLGRGPGDEVHDLRHQRERGTQPFSVSAGFSALSDDDVSAHLDCSRCLPDVVHLADQRDTCGPDTGCVRRGISEGQKERGRTSCQCMLQDVLVSLQGPGDESTSHRGGHLVELLAHPVRAGVAATEQAQPAGGTDRTREARIGHVVHGRQDHRMLDAEAVCEPGIQGHASTVGSHETAGPTVSSDINVLYFRMIHSIAT